MSGPEIQAPAGVDGIGKAPFGTNQAIGQTPTVGRIVHYRAVNDFIGNGNAPLAAIVCYVHENKKIVNLSVYDQTGRPMPRVLVALVQEGDEPPVGLPYCEWPART